MAFRRRSTDAPTDRIWVMQAGSNRLAQETVRGVTYVFNNNGARQSAAVGGFFEEKYWYDGLGRTSGVAELGPGPKLGPNRCRYDPDGQLYRPCDDDAPWLAFDGANVVTTFNDEWRFVQGPGVDDPLVGLMRPATGGSRLLYFITDGAGRQLMVTDNSGKLDANDLPGPGNPRGHWRYAGATASANTFNGDRQNPINLPTVALFRNRLYDQKSGRWTQEDPAGISDGPNLYLYNGNNPVRFSDPFGLQVRLPFMDPNLVFQPVPSREMVLEEAGKISGRTMLVLGAIGGLRALFKDIIGAPRVVPNPGGRLGGPGHRSTVEETAAQLEGSGAKIIAGGGRLPERAIRIPGGRIRYPDIIAIRPDNTAVYVNVGRVTKSGAPVSREAKAISDLEKTGVETIFIPYTP